MHVQANPTAPLQTQYAGVCDSSNGNVKVEASDKRKLSELDDPCDENADDNKQKRSRGRPRLDTKDETAADRRRTQIRLAQRAYRHRKDTAITTLEDRVKELEKINSQMTQEFNKFYDIMLSERMLEVSPQVSERLRRITDKIMRLGALNSEASGYLSPEDDRIPNAKSHPQAPDKSTTTESDGSFSPHRKPQHSHDLPQVEPFTPSATHSFTSSHPQTQMAPPVVAASYEIVAHATPQNASFPFCTPINSAPSPSFVSFLPPPQYTTASIPQATYAFPPINFSQRLRRRTQERSLALASMTSPPAERYAAVFGFCLLFETKEDIVRRLKRNIQEDCEIDISLWKAKFDGDSNPAKLDEADRLEQQIRLIFANYRQDFLNTDESEVYMRQLGILIPPESDFVDAEIDLNVLKDVPNTQEMRDAMALQSQVVDFNNASLATATSMAPSQPLVAITAPIFTIDTPIAPVGTPVSLAYPDGVSRMWPEPTWSKTKITISIKVLIEEMVSGSVCLGKTPGIRINDIHKAIRIASGLSHN